MSASQPALTHDRASAADGRFARSRQADQPGAGGDADWLPLATLEAACLEELERAVSGAPTDGTFGHQLFRRALVDGDEQAWAALDRVYRAPLLYWARAHPLYRRAGEEAEALANQALARLWRGVGPARFAAFPNLRALLAYLRRCLHRLIVDHARTRTREEARAHALGRAQLGERPATPASRALARLAEAETWGVVRGHCHDEREARLAYGVLLLGLKPRELLVADPEGFGSVGTINAMRSVLVMRLRRCPELRWRRQGEPSRLSAVPVAKGGTTAMEG
jgi:DNA-directed RNA polymerase specialized sigma24 family protein